MKRLVYFLGFSIFLFSFMACSSDDDHSDSSSSNHYFEYDSNVYDVKTMSIERGVEDMTDEGIIPYYFIFSTVKLILDEDGEIMPTTSPVTMVGFELNSDGGLHPNTGTYPVTDQEGNDTSNNIIQYGIMAINLDVESEDLTEDDFDELHAITDGELKIISSGDLYELEFNFTLDNGKSLIGYYKGEDALVFDETPYPIMGPHSNPLERQAQIFQ